MIQAYQKTNILRKILEIEVYKTLKVENHFCVFIPGGINMAVENNDKVAIQYKGTLEDGTVFDTSEGREALEFVVGKGMVIPGFEKGIVGLNEGDKKTIEILPEDGYGPVMKELVQEVPKTALPAEITPEVGMMLSAQGPNGQMIPVKVAEIGEETIKLDMNHPLAGQKLTFDVTVEKVTKAGEFEEEEETDDDGCGPEGCASCSSCGGH